MYQYMCINTHIYIYMLRYIDSSLYTKRISYMYKYTRVCVCVFMCFLGTAVKGNTFPKHAEA